MTGISKKNRKSEKIEKFYLIFSMTVAKMEIYLGSNKRKKMNITESLYKKIIQFNNMCISEVRNSQFTGLILESYSKLIGLERCQFATLNNEKKVVYIDERGDPNIARIYFQHEDQDIWRPEKVKLPMKGNALFIDHINKKRNISLAKSNQLYYDMLHKGKVQDSIIVSNNKVALIGVRLGTIPLKSDELSLHSFCSAVANNCFKIHLGLTKNVSEIVKKYKITSREAQIIRQIKSGMFNSEIAQNLYVSEQTIKRHIYNIFQKTGVRNRIELFNLFDDNKLQL